MPRFRNWLLANEVNLGSLFEKYLNLVHASLPIQIHGVQDLITQYFNPRFFCQDCNKAVFFHCQICVHGVHEDNSICKQCQTCCKVCHASFSVDDPRCNVCDRQVHLQCSKDDYMFKQGKLHCTIHWPGYCRCCYQTSWKELQCKHCRREACCDCVVDGLCKFCQEKHTCKCCAKILYGEEWFRCGNEFCLCAYHARCVKSMKYKTRDGDWKICFKCWERWPSYARATSYSRRERALRKSEIINAGFVWNSLLCKNFKQGWETHAEFERKYRLFQKIGSWDQECEIKFCADVPGKLILHFVHRREQLRKMLAKHGIAYDQNEFELYRPYFECRPGQELRQLAKITWAKIEVTKIDIRLLRLESFLCEISISDLLTMKKKVLFQSMFKGSSSWHALL